MKKRLRELTPGLGLLFLLLLIRCDGPAQARPPLRVPCASAPLAIASDGSLSPALRARVARLFAPELRFNAWVSGDPSPQNRNEDLFPMSVARFLREACAGAPRVLVESSRDGSPAISEVRSYPERPAIEDGVLGGFPRDMVGDPPGEAPTYVHVYEDSSRRAIDGSGAGELTVYVEYWVFYPMDRCEPVVLGSHMRGADDRFGHRGDWEHITLRARVELGALGAWREARLEEVVFFGHDKRFVVPAEDLILAEGRHPVVFISQGKHASYPAPGRFELVPLPGWVAAHTDVFRGNGVRVETWKAPLLDLEDPASAPAEFSPPEWEGVLARSKGEAQAATDWTLYGGRWGEDRIARIEVFGHTIALGNSPTAPRAKSTWTDFGGRGRYTLWRDYVAEHLGGRLTLFDEPPPQVLPPPAVIRR